MRKSHNLSRIHSCAMPREMVVFDTETNPLIHPSGTMEHMLAFGWALYSRVNNSGVWTEPSWFRFDEPQALWYFIEEHCREKNHLYTFCHNANFDWQVTRMCTILPANGWLCEKAIIEDPPNCFVWRQGAKRITCLDSTNFWPQSLAAIGERIGLQKLSMPDNWTDAATADAYCRRDVLIVYNALLDWFQWLSDNRLGKFAISKAGQAMVAFRHRFMAHKIHIHDNDKALALERESYMGGRTEAWTVGRELNDLICVDVNSMYPAVMAQHDFPCKLVGVYGSPTRNEIADWLSRYCVVARAWLCSESPIYPVRTRNGIYFPVGQFAATLTSPEIALALDRGHLLGVTSAAVYERAPLFTAFIHSLYDLRLQFARSNDETAKYNTKVMMNSLYGKFGQRGGHDEIIGYTDDLSIRVEDEVDLETGQRFRIRFIAGVIIARSLEGEARDSFPAISSHVTAHGRALLWSLAERAGLDNVHYMDTDSLHIAASAVSRLADIMDEEKLGHLKVEKRIAAALYHGPKDYVLDELATIKGVKRNATLIEPGVYEQEQWVSIRGSLALSHNGGPLTRRVRKHLKREYRKGVVSSSGRVVPFRLDWKP